VISIRRRVIPGTHPNAGSFKDPKLEDFTILPSGVISNEPENEDQKDVVYVPQNMMPSRSPETTESEPDPAALFSFLEKKIHESEDDFKGTQISQPLLQTHSPHPNTNIQWNKPTEEIHSNSHFNPHIQSNNNSVSTGPASDIMKRNRNDPARVHGTDSYQVSHETSNKTNIHAKDDESSKGLFSRNQKPTKSSWRIDPTVKEEMQREAMLKRRQQGSAQRPAHKDIRRRSPYPQQEMDHFEQPHPYDTSFSQMDPLDPDMDHFTKYFVESGFMNVKEDPSGSIGEESHEHHYDILSLLPEELRDYLTKMQNPKERKKMLGEVYKTRVFVASYWMMAILLVLQLLPDSTFFAPFIAGYIGGRKAGSVWKGIIAALVPFIILGIIDVLLYYNIIYHFYDLYASSVGILTHNILATLAEFGLNTGGMGGSFYGSGGSLSKSCVYMTIAAILGGTLEADERGRLKETANLVNVSNISSQLKRKIWKLA